MQRTGGARTRRACIWHLGHPRTHLGHFGAGEAAQQHASEARVLEEVEVDAELALPDVDRREHLVEL